MIKERVIKIKGNSYPLNEQTIEILRKYVK